QPQPRLRSSKNGTHQKRPLEQVLGQRVALHPGVEAIAGVAFSPRDDKTSFRLLLDQPEIQKEQVTEIDHYPLDVPGQGQGPESRCTTFHSAGRAIKQEGQQLPKANPKPVKTVFGPGRRL